MVNKGIGLECDPMTKPQSDDLDAVRKVVDALDGFEAKDQERIIRWAREKLQTTVSRD